MFCTSYVVFSPLPSSVQDVKAKVDWQLIAVRKNRNLISVSIQIIFFFITATAQDAYEGQLKLVAANPNSNQSTSRGMLQVYLNQQWTYICNGTFGINEADTSCRQLGYTKARTHSIVNNYEYRLVMCILYNTDSRSKYTYDRDDAIPNELFQSRHTLL